MAERTRADLFLLKQYGFSDKYLDWLYVHTDHEHILEQAFSTPLMVDNKVECTKKDRSIQTFQGFQNFFMTNRNDILNNFGREKIKLLFKYDSNCLDSFIPTEDRPMFFYLKGNADLIDRQNKFVALIGTRELSTRYADKARDLTDMYTYANYVIVSGLAKGTDTVVHQRTVQNHGNALAVLPTNFRNIYPRQNQRLADDIYQTGLAITAVGPYENTFKARFLERNQYVASIADEIVVVETGLRSGTMNTIHNALKLGKKVLYLPQLSEEVNDYLNSIGAKSL